MLANYIASLHGSESSYMVDDNKDIIGILLPHDMLANYRASWHGSESSYMVDANKDIIGVRFHTNGSWRYQ